MVKVHDAFQIKGLKVENKLFVFHLNNDLGFMGCCYYGLLLLKL